MDIRQSLQSLNFYLKKKNLNRSFIICGGASLILQGIIARTTRDIDIVAPPIDQALTEVAASVAEDLGLDSHWLNSGPGSIVQDLKDGWEKRVQEIFKDTNLVVYSIARDDLIFTKFWALCDRQKDFEDLILLKPTLAELNQAVEYTKTRDANPDWTNWIDKQAKRLKKELGYE
ncbi:MAG: hypothetical protein A2X86_21600 [Bdellovibrionales bacterium GWA2_49_15]|nr:MAG: hypothetical protein A2X86_21600 [Bdellovibrionales bacterium GWA2_49_15]HAZ11562.1 hypothetical protein [Bdellovibrionales bacterium]